MSQNDFNIANQGFPATRADINLALQALASTSAGATAPSTTYAYQMWYDETADLLKMRNSDNDAWITLAAFDQATDEWEIRTAAIQAVDSAGVVIKTDDGVARISVADSGAVSIGGNLAVDTNTLFVDASNNRVGVGTSTPDASLNVAGSDVSLGTSTSSGYNEIHFYGNRDDTARAGRIMKNFDSPFDMRIRASSSTANAPLIFETSNTNERLRIGAGGQIGIGGANYGTSGQVLTSNGSGAAVSWQDFSSLGVGQTWQNVSASRAAGTTYTNTTGKPIVVNICTQVSDSGDLALIIVDGVTVARNHTASVSGANNREQMTMTAIVPNNSTYQLTSDGAGRQLWAELR